MSQSEYWTEFMHRRLSRRRLLKAGTVTGVGLWVGSALGCGGTTASPTETAKSQGQASLQVGTTPQAAPTKGPLTGQVTVGIASALFYQKGGDVHTHTSGFAPLTATTVCDSLVTYDNNLNLMPALATSWTIEDGARAFRFTLDKRAKFHNGEPVTAADIKFSLERAMRPELKWILATDFTHEYVGTEIVDDSNLVIRFKDPFMGLWKRLWWSLGIYPKKYVEQVGDDGLADKPIGSGPFKWVDYKQDSYMTMEGWPEHYRKSPEFKTLKIVYNADHATRLAMLKSGEADIVQLSGPTIQDARNTSSLRLTEVKYVSSTVLTYCDLVFPNEPSPLLDKRVRQAVSYAIDRDTICKKILFGAAEPWGQAVSPLHYGYDPSIKPDPYDPKQAKALLAEAGYSNGFDTTFSLTEPSRFWVEAVVANLADVGIKAKLNVMEAGAYQTAVWDKKLRGFITGSGWYDVEKPPAWDLDTGYRSTFPGTFMGSQELDDVLQRGQAAVTEEDMTKSGKEIDKVIRDGLLRTHLWANYSVWGVGPKIGTFEPQQGALPATRYEYIKMK